MITEQEQDRLALFVIALAQITPELHDDLLQSYRYELVFKHQLKQAANLYVQECDWLVTHASNGKDEENSKEVRLQLFDINKSIFDMFELDKLEGDKKESKMAVLYVILAKFVSNFTEQLQTEPYNGLFKKSLINRANMFIGASAPLLKAASTHFDSPLEFNTALISYHNQIEKMFNECEFSAI